MPTPDREQAPNPELAETLSSKNTNQQRPKTEHAQNIYATLMQSFIYRLARLVSDPKVLRGRDRVWIASPISPFPVESELATSYSPVLDEK